MSDQGCPVACGQWACSHRQADEFGPIDPISIAKYGVEVPRTHEQIASDELLGRIFGAAAADFNRQMAKVQAVLGGAGGDLDALREWARPCIADQDPGLWGDQA